MNYAIHLLIFMSIYAILAQGLNIVLGLGNLFTLAHIGLYSIGAYATALCARDLGMNPFCCLLVSALTAGLAALIVGAISTRLKHDYFALGSLALASVINALEINWKTVTNGVLGISAIPRPTIFRVELNENLQFLFFSLGICIVVLGLSMVLWKSAFVRKLRAQAEFENAALSLGCNASLMRNLAFFAGAVLAGIAGSLFSYFMSYIDPSSFALNEMIFVLTIVVVGQPGSFVGVILATIFFVLLPEGLRFIKIPSEYIGPGRQLMYALILFFAVYMNRYRLFPQRRTI